MKQIGRRLWAASLSQGAFCVTDNKMFGTLCLHELYKDLTRSNIADMISSSEF